MTTRVAAVCLGALLASGVAMAGDVKVLVQGPIDPAGTPADHVLPETLTGPLPYRVEAYKGAAQLKMSRPFVEHVLMGLDLLYERRYREARTFFAEVEQAFPNSAVSALGDVLIWQSMMMENFDFRYDDQYRAASKLARAKLDVAQTVPGNEGWETLTSAVVVGIEAIHNARQGRYLPALTLAFDAIDGVERTRRLAPEFTDPALADGLYNYWRTVITQRSKALPNFGDKKAEGIQQIQAVVDKGVFLKPMARLAQAFTWLEERKYDKAAAELTANRALYPGNIINELMLGMTDLYRKRHTDALASFDHILKVDPKSRRVHYYRGLALQRMGRTDEAVTAFQTYLGFDEMEPYQRAGAHYRLGQIAYNAKQFADAWGHYQEAVRIDGHSSAKASMDLMKKRKRDGEITF